MVTVKVTCQIFIKAFSRKNGEFHKFKTILNFLFFNIYIFGATVIFLGAFNCFFYPHERLKFVDSDVNLWKLKLLRT